MSSLNQDSLLIQKGDCSAQFSPRHGGMMTSLVMQAPEGARELLYFAPEFDFNNYHGMNGGAPFCFPICGRLQNSEYQYQGQTFKMKIHGFAYLMPWVVEHYSSDEITLSLQANDESLRQYPFKFKIVLSYQILDNQLICKQRYENLDAQPMPYYAGFHPYLRLPFPKETVFFNYRPLKRLQYNADLTDVIGEAPLFKTPTNLLLPELNESLVRMGSDKLVTLSFPDGSELSIAAQGVQDPDLFAYVQLYHRLNEPFLCIEPWMSFPNAINHQFGVRWLAPGQVEEGVFTLSLK